MTRREFEQWLVAEAGTLTRDVEDARQHERKEVAELERQIQTGGLPSASSLILEIDALSHEDTALDERLRNLNEEVAGLCAVLVGEITAGLAHLNHAVDARAWHDAQRLFAARAPGDVSMPLEQNSFAMLQHELKRSTLPAALRQEVTELLQQAHEMLKRPVTGEEADAVTRAAALRLEVEQLEERLANHGVGSSIIAGVAALRDRDWFLEDVIDTYTRAAQAERAWNTSDAGLKEMGLGS